MGQLVGVSHEFKEFLISLRPKINVFQLINVIHLIFFKQFLKRNVFLWATEISIPEIHVSNHVYFG